MSRRNQKVFKGLYKVAAKLGIKVRKSKRRSVCRFRLTTTGKFIAFEIRLKTTGHTLRNIGFLAHELGHATARYRPTKPNTKDQYQEELNAWERGRRIIKRLGYNKWSDFEAIRDECLKTYEVV